MTIDLLHLPDHATPFFLIKMVNGLRRKRIAKGSGVEVSDINQMLKQFETMRKMMKQMSGGGKKQAMQQMQQMFGGKTNLPF